MEEKDGDDGDLLESCPLSVELNLLSPLSEVTDVSSSVSLSVTSLTSECCIVSEITGFTWVGNDF